MSQLRLLLIVALLLGNLTTAVLAETAKVQLAITGMTCGSSCAKAVKEKLTAIPGVLEVDVDFTRSLATVVIDPAKTKAQTVADQLWVKSFGRYSAAVIKG